MIIKELNQNIIKFDNIYLNKLLAYTAIINSLNYKWYKSSKRRFLLPNFYFTKSFYNFYNLFFLKNIFRKKIQSSTRHSLLTSLGFFEKKMFLKHVNTEEFLKSSNSYFFFLKDSSISFLKNDRFFFKKNLNVLNNNSSLFVSNDFNIDLETNTKLNLFKKNTNTVNSIADFNVLVFFHITSTSILEIYKIIVLLNLNLVS